MHDQDPRFFELKDMGKGWAVTQAGACTLHASGAECQPQACTGSLRSRQQQAAVTVDTSGGARKKQTGHKNNG
jgi:hypothetical protein